jgi:hypothetical protein
MSLGPAKRLIGSAGAKENGVPAGTLIEAISLGHSACCWDLRRANGAGSALVRHCSDAQKERYGRAHADKT